MSLQRHQHLRTARFTHRRTTDGRVLVEGVAYPSLDPESFGEAIPREEAKLRIDSYGTWMRPEVLERFAHQFLRHARAIDSHHDHGEVGSLAESFLTREGNPDYPAGLWVTRVEVTNPVTIAELDDGTLTGFSIEFVSPIATRTLKVLGENGKAQRVNTGEITDPLPLYLSLVERPAIGIAFERVETRAAVAEFVQTRAEADDVGRARRVTACPSGEMPDEAAPQPAPDPQPAAVEAPAETSEAPPPAEPDSATAPSEPVTAPAEGRAAEVPAAEAPSPETPVAEAQRLRCRALVELVGVERADDLHKRSEYKTDFGEAWGEIKTWLATWGGVWDATYVYEDVLYNIRYSGLGEAEKYAAIAKAAQDYAAVIGEITGSGAAAVGSRGAPEQRAGKKISKATAEKIQCARDAANAACGHLDELLALAAGGEGETDAEDGETEQMSALRELREQLAAARAETEQATRQRAAVEQERDKAAARVRELESMRPAPRSASEEIEGTPAQFGTPEEQERQRQRRIWTGTLLPVGG